MRTATGLTSTPDPTSSTDSLTAGDAATDPTSTSDVLVRTTAALAVACSVTTDGQPADEPVGPDDRPAEPALPCWTTDPDLWFAEAPADVEAAKALCVPCPLREACLAGALERREPWGVWGGQLIVAGVVVPRKRPRGRPRKVDVAA